MGGFHFVYFEYFVYFVIFDEIFIMKALEQIGKPSKLDQKIAGESYSALASVIEQIHSDQPEIEIEETNDKIKIPLSALKLLGEILKAMSQGKFISIVPIAAEVTTQAAAEILGCSRPHLVKLLEEGKIAFTKVGKHRRIKLDDIMKYRKQMKEQQKQNIIDIMNLDEETGLYDS
jgi:excisionase family DNA binding protein